MISSIKTEYHGIEFKSRLEANMAYILDLMDYNWEYEPKSFLLENGEHYQPDFYVPKLKLWIETRGYESEKGEKQIEGFYKLLANNWDVKTPTENKEYLVIKNNECLFYGTISPGEIANIAKCTECGHYFFYSEIGDYTCRYCGVHAGDHHLRIRGDISLGPDSELHFGKYHDYKKLKTLLREG